jgi:type III secretion system YseE family protein
MARITYLEDTLYQDNEGSARDFLLSRLRDAEVQLHRQMRVPHTREAYAALLRCAQASASAQVVIETLWGRYHADDR